MAAMDTAYRAVKRMVMRMLARRVVAVGVGLGALLIWSVAAPGYAHDSGLAIVRYAPDGTLDASFGGSGVVAERTVPDGLVPEALVVQTAGKTVLAGTASDLATAAVGFGLARYKADGSLDSGFGTGGRVLTRMGATNAEAHAMAVLPDGDLLVAGSGFAAVAAVSSFALARYTPAGSLDRSFGSGDGVVLTPIGASGAEARAIAVQADGRIVVAGTAFANGTANDELALARYNVDGSLDPTFGSGGSFIAAFDLPGAEPGASPFRTAAVLIQSDGKLVAVGSAGGHQAVFALARYLPDGELDTGFGAGGTAISTRASSAQAYAAVLQPDGKIVVAGSLGGPNESVALALARYAPTGDLDAGFGSGGFVTTTFAGGGSGAHALYLGADGKLVAVGAGYASAPPPPTATAGQTAARGGFAAVRYLPDGTTDPSFGKGGVVLTTAGDAGSMPAAVGLQADGKIVAAGLTYFLVPTPPTADRINVTRVVILSVAGLVLVAGVIFVRGRRNALLRSGGSRIGREPGA